MAGASAGASLKMLLERVDVIDETPTCAHFKPPEGWRGKSGGNEHKIKLKNPQYDTGLLQYQGELLSELPEISGVKPPDNYQHGFSRFLGDLESDQALSSTPQPQAKRSKQEQKQEQKEDAFLERTHLQDACQMCRREPVFGCCRAALETTTTTTRFKPRGGCPCRTGYSSSVSLCMQFDEAVKSGRVERVRELLQTHSHLRRHFTHCLDNDGETTLHTAAARGYTEIVNLLIEAGADREQYARNSDGTSRGNGFPLHKAARGGHLKCVEALLARRQGDDALIASRLANDTRSHRHGKAINQVLEGYRIMPWGVEIFERLVTAEHEGSPAKRLTSMLDPSSASTGAALDGLALGRTPLEIMVSYADHAPYSLLKAVCDAVEAEIREKDQALHQNTGKLREWMDGPRRDAEANLAQLKASRDEKHDAALRREVLPQLQAASEQLHAARERARKLGFTHLNFMGADNALADAMSDVEGAAADGPQGSSATANRSTRAACKAAITAAPTLSAASTSVSSEPFIRFLQQMLVEDKTQQRCIAYINKAMESCQTPHTDPAMNALLGAIEDQLEPQLDELRRRRDAVN